MIDIGQDFYEEKAYYFNQIAALRIIINPNVKGYPPLFLVCKGKFGSRTGAYIIALSFLQLNKLMMEVMENDLRLQLAEKLTDFLIPRDRSGEINLVEFFGEPLSLEGLDLATRVNRFRSDATDNEPLYYFQLSEI